MTVHSTRRDGLRRALLAATAIGAFLLLTIGPVDGASVTVKAVNYEFQPASRTVKVGDVVRWTFSGETHTVTSGTPGAPDGRFDSGFKDPGTSFQVTFDRAGTFPFFCQIHSEQMFGTIIVRASETSTPSPTATSAPTQKPTARPSTRPTATPTAASSEAPSRAPSAAPTATPSVSAAPSAAPTESSAGVSPGSGDPVSPSSAPSVGPNDGTAAASVNPVVFVVGAIVIGLLVAGGLAMARRSRRP